MKKYFLVPQPPLTEKFNFLVDDLTDNKTLGFTYDIDKIKYNLKMMGDDFNHDLEIGINFLEKGITDVVDCGRYIAVVGIKKDRTEGKISFFDTTTSFTREELYGQIVALYDKSIANKFIDIYDLMISDEIPSFDNVELIIPDDL